MSKSDTALEFIDTDRAKKPLGEPSFAGDTPVNGFDTETADGDIFAIGMYLGGDRDEYLERVKDRALTDAEVLELLTYKPLRNCLNFWFNLNFDANSVLKFLPKENLRQLNVQNRTKWSPEGRDKPYTFTYIPKKVLKIQDGNGHTYAHYDVAQFTYTSLEGAAEDWLGIEEGKLNEELDVTKFGLLKGPTTRQDLYNAGVRPVNAYSQNRLDEISKYLKQDCKLTRDVAREIVRTAEQEVSPAIPMGKPYSTGYIAADYVKNRNEHGLKYEPHAVQEPFWKAYRGGRFEIIKRGAVGDVAGPDINSAYPAVYADLPNPGTLDWRLFGDSGPKMPVSDLDLETLADADYGAVKVRVTTDPDRPVQPFAVSNPNQNGRVEYPALKDVTLWVLKDTLEYAIETDLVTDFELKGAALGYENSNTEKPFSWASDLYDKRKRLEAQGRDKPAKLIKIVLNSLYGKTCQTQLKQVPVEEAPETLEKWPQGLDPADVRLTPDFDDLPDDYTPVVDDKTGELYIEYQQAGGFFNPFMASYITGMTRLKLLKGVVENNLESNVVMLATDCLMFEKEAFEGSALEEAADSEPDSYADALGGWDYDYVGDGFVVGSGVYEVDRYDKDELKQGLRGFTDFHSSDYDSLKDGFTQDPDGLDLTSTRPLTYGDILHLGKSMAEIGRFVDSGRSLNPDMDTKRQWPGTVDGNDLVNGCQDSKPKVLCGDKGIEGWSDN